MEFTLLELNELIYCVGTATKTGTMVNKKVANKLWAQLTDELERRCNEVDRLMKAETEPESMFDDIWTPGFGQPEANKL
jgi:hypothetical protein